MSIATAIQNAQGKVADCYTAISGKGGTLPATQNLSNMPTAINSIPSGGSINNQDKTITQNGTYTADEGYTGLGTVTVNVDNNKKKFGLTIDDLIGDLNNGQYTMKTTADVDVSFDGLTSFQKISGGGSSSTRIMYHLFTNARCIRSITFPSLVTIAQTPSDVFCNMCEENLTIQSVSFPVLKTISAGSAFVYAFSGCSSLTSVSFPALESSGLGSFSLSFGGCTNLTNVTFPSLKVIARNCFSQAFNNSGIVEVRFPSVTSIGQDAFSRTFSYSANLGNVYFDSVTSSSFDSSCFLNMFLNVGTSVIHTVHFPSNVETAVQGLTGYPLFGGTSGNVVLAFDLPATE